MTSVNYFFCADFLFFVCSSFQIAYQIARSQFSGRLKETFLVMSDDEPRPVVQPEASRMSLEERVKDRE